MKMHSESFKFFAFLQQFLFLLGAMFFVKILPRRGGDFYKNRRLDIDDEKKKIVFLLKNLKTGTAFTTKTYCSIIQEKITLSYKKKNSRRGGNHNKISTTILLS